MSAATANMSSRDLDYYSLKLSHGAQPSPQQNDMSGFDKALPGFPARYVGERVWSGPEMARKPHGFITILSETDQNDILEALRHFQSLSLNPGSIGPETFPLPDDLSRRLKRISDDCHKGRGFGILRGLRPERFTDEEGILLFAGISSHVAPERGFQDVNRELVTCHIISEETKPGSKEANLRPAFTNGRLAFHTDVGDILALYAMDVSSNGGETMIASSSQIYNELAATRPDLLQELMKKWVFYDSHDYYTDGTPLINNTSGDKLVFQYSRLPITGFRNEAPNPTLPAPTQKRLEAMDYIEELAWKHGFALPRQKGDIAYINNLCIMHGRNAFDLDEEGNPLPSKRHLVKMMLRDPALRWELPEYLNWYSQRVFGPNREDGSRVEKWQLSLTPDQSLPNGRIWVGTGTFNNG
ncbi:hypothetical protein F4775DRAFT_255975 [Biscogniauxia sp. FL1348]|nr:hypothetical protein F4775DRAFT_255975 [Biscogniauxia sp. FL1348]